MFLEMSRDEAHGGRGWGFGHCIWAPTRKKEGKKASSRWPYADGLRGFCIVFDEKLVAETEPEAYITDVAYLAKPPIVDSFVYAVAYNQEDYHLTEIEEAQPSEQSWISDCRAAADAARKLMQQLSQHAFAAKPIEWRYEKERRLLVQTDRENNEPTFRTYPREAVKEIIVGERMPSDYLARLTTILKDQFGDIPLRTAHRSSDLYTLIVE